MRSTQDFFSLFSLPHDFDIELKTLNARFRELQVESHPDRVAAEDEATKLAAVQRSSLLNDAYATLKSPLGRAAHLLALAGVSVDEVSQADLDREVLFEQMQLREAVAEAPEGDDGLAVLEPLKKEIAARIHQREQNFVQSLTAEDLGVAKRVFHELQFLHKLFQEIETSEEQRLAY